MEENSNPKVSIVVPIYNVEKYLRQCLDSIIYQTLKDIEIILVDDGSKDSCPAIVDEYAEKDSRIVAIHQMNGGYGRAVNHGLEVATGEYLGIVESDDYAELDMFEKLYNTAKLHNLDIVRCDFYYYNSRENTHTASDASFVPHSMICKPQDTPPVLYQMPAIWSNIYRADMIRKNHIRFLETPGASYQDTSFILKCYVCTNRFMMIENNFIHYRIDNEASSVNSPSKVFCVCDEYEEIYRFVREKNVLEKLKYIIPKMQFACYLWNYRRLDYKNGCKFLNRFSKEMRKHFSEGAINKELFSKEDRQRMFVIAYFPVLYKVKRFFHHGVSV